MTYSVKKAQDDFVPLSMEEKKELLLSVLEKIKDKHDSLLSVYTILSSGVSVTEEWMDGVYSGLMDLVQQGDDKKRAAGLEQIEKSSSALEKMREKEAFDRGQEDADALLEEI